MPRDAVTGQPLPRACGSEHSHPSQAPAASSLAAQRSPVLPQGTLTHAHQRGSHGYAPCRVPPACSFSGWRSQHTDRGGCDLWALLGKGAGRTRARAEISVRPWVHSSSSEHQGSGISAFRNALHSRPSTGKAFEPSQQLPWTSRPQNPVTSTKSHHVHKIPCSYTHFPGFCRYEVAKPCPSPHI